MNIVTSTITGNWGRLMAYQWAFTDHDLDIAHQDIGLDIDNGIVSVCATLDTAPINSERRMAIVSALAWNLEVGIAGIYSWSDHENGAALLDDETIDAELSVSIENNRTYLSLAMSSKDASRFQSDIDFAIEEWIALIKENNTAEEPEKLHQNEIELLAAHVDRRPQLLEDIYNNKGLVERTQW